MKKIFAPQGVPEVVISDNGPQYSSKEVKEFLKSWNFHHYTSSPHHPKGNGTAEAALKQAKRPCSKVIQVNQGDSAEAALKQAKRILKVIWRKLHSNKLRGYSR